MIGRLAGRIVHRGTDHVVIDVGGVGYVVHVSERTLAALPRSGELVALHTELLVREDLLQLFGFLTAMEKEWHRLLTSVQGVGAKGALAILSTLGPDGVGRAIALGDAAAVKAAPGVGPKIAQRLVNELRDRAPSVMALGGAIDGEAEPLVTTGAGSGTGATAPSTGTPRTGGGAAAQAEAMSALGNLGYGPSEAARAVAEATTDGELETAPLIRAALRLLAPKG